MKEYNKDFKNSLAYYLPWDYLLEDNIVINKYSGLQLTIRVRNYDLGYAEKGTVISFLGRFNNDFKKWRMPGQFIMKYRNNYFV